MTCMFNRIAVVVVVVAAVVCRYLHICMCVCNFFTQATQCCSFVLLPQGLLSPVKWQDILIITRGPSYTLETERLEPSEVWFR